LGQDGEGTGDKASFKGSLAIHVVDSFQNSLCDTDVVNFLDSLTVDIPQAILGQIS
jgi:hypothetical protein